jgi:hypothetical protein
MKPFHPTGGSLEKAQQNDFPWWRDWSGRIFRPSVLGLGLVFAVTAYAGASIVAFERLQARLAGEEIASAGSGRRSQLGAVAGWKNTASVASRARSLSLDVVLAETPGDSTAIDNALHELAAGSPVSVAVWQALLAFRGTMGAPRQSVLAAFRMSALTGSHEGYFVMQRAIFGLEHWNDLPEADRRIVTRDLLLTALNWDFGRRGERYRAILAKKSDAERGDIRASITASGMANAEVMQALGMQ